ncbi:MAG: hypothetical protein ACK4OM_07020 [Alphaproteobacteria bacterium]
MRTNWIQYSVEDRVYKKGEVLSLINDEPYKHYILAGQQNTTWAALFENLEPLKNCTFGVAKWAVSSALSVAWSIAYALGIKYVIQNTPLINYIGGDGDTFIINNTTNNYNDTKFKITDLNQGSYTGREVTKFLNEYYDKPILGFMFDYKTHYQNVMGDFLDHAYIDAEVPTLGEQNWYDFSSIAVLDAI